MAEFAIKIEGLSKKYDLGGTHSLTIADWVRSLKSSQKALKEEFWALNDINLEIHKGEAIGVIGKNGAGKSTLLKILSKITYPTRGRFEMTGRVSSLLEVGTGFHPELSGRENIFLNGTILGMTRKEIKAKFDEIVEFSGVSKFLDTPVKHYSSGMYVRLAFSVAAHLEPEILIIDEVLAVGDAEFQKKCLGKMEDVAHQGRTVIFVTHFMPSVQRLCDRVIWFEKGQVKSDSKDVKKITESYLFGDRSTTSDSLTNIEFENDYLSVSSLSVKPDEGHEITYDSKIIVGIEGAIKQFDEDLNIGFALFDINNNKLFEAYSGDSQIEMEITEHFKLNFEIPASTLNLGEYSIEILADIRYRKRLIKPSDLNRLGFKVTVGLPWSIPRLTMIAPLIKSTFLTSKT